MACSGKSDWAERVTLVGLLLLGCGRGAVLPAGAPPLAELPFDFSGGLIYLRGVVNRDSAWLILDTGTSKTGVDREWAWTVGRSEEHTSELQSRLHLVCRLLLEK